MYNIGMKKYDYILFDLDGTVTDSKPGIITCIKYALDSKGICYTQEVLDKMIGPPFRVSMQEFFGLEMDVIEQLIALYRGMYEKGGWKDCKIYDGVTELLSRLKDGGKRLAIATSKPIKFTSIMTAGLDLNKYFDYVGGASCDASKESKADVIELVLEKLGVSDRSKVLMLGDRKYDIIGARAAGVDVAGVLWGYGSREELESYEPDYILSTPSDVAKLALCGIYNG